MVSLRSAAHSLGESALSFASSSYARHMNFTAFSLLRDSRQTDGLRTRDHEAPEEARLAHWKVATGSVLHRCVVPDQDVVRPPRMGVAGSVPLRVVLQ